MKSADADKNRFRFHNRILCINFFEIFEFDKKSSL
jgi:hypothetical protein